MSGSVGVEGTRGPEPLFGTLSYGRAFALLLLLSALFRLLYSPLVPLTGDELMHWQWSRHLALGYPEHPPLIAWLIALFTSVLGQHETSVRLVSILAVTGTFAVCFRLGRELYGERAAFLGVVPMMTIIIFNAGGLLANTDGLLSFFFALTAYTVKKAVLDGKRTAWIGVGLSMGLCMLSKLPGVFLIPALFLVLAGTREGRPWLRRVEPYGALLLALIVFSPPIIWNIQHDWFTIAMRVGHQKAGGFTLRYLGELLGAQLLIASPLLFIWLLWALWGCWKRRSDSRAVLLGSFFAVPFLFYLSYSVTARSGVHWPAVGYVTGFVAAGAFTATAARTRFGPRYLIAGSLVALLLTGALFTVPLIPDRLADWALWYRPDKVNTREIRGNVIDWREVGESIQELLDESGKGAFLVCRNGYGLANLVAFYTPSQPEVFLWRKTMRNGRAYQLWREAADLEGRDAVIVHDPESGNPEFLEEIRCCFDGVSETRRVEIRRRGDVVREFDLVRASGFRGFPPEPDKKERRGRRQRHAERGSE